MKKINNYLKAAGISYILGSILFPENILVVKIILMIIGTVLVAYSLTPKEEVNNKGLLLLLAIISSIVNVPAAVFLFLIVDEINYTKQVNNNSPPEEKYISEESKRIDILLKIGLGMILVSGILFATTSWEIISDIVKVIVLIFMGITFLGLSKFSETKLKIHETTKAYYILGLAFFLLTWVGIGYFRTFSDWFSYFGEGKYLVYFITYAILSTILYLINKKFSSKLYLYLTYISCLFSIISLLSFFNLPITLCVLILSIVSLILNIFSEDSKLIEIKNLNEVINYVYWALIVINILEVNWIITLIASIITIANSLYVSTRNTSNLENVYIAITGNILIICNIFNLVSTNNLIWILLFSTLTILSIIISCIKKITNKWLIITNKVIYHLVTLITIIIYYFISPLNTLIITSIYLIYNIISSLNQKNIIDYYYQPIIILIFNCIFIGYLNSTIFNLKYIIPSVGTTIIYAIINSLGKTQTTKEKYLIATITLGIITFMGNASFQGIIVSFILTLLSIYLFLSINRKKTWQKVVAYIFILLNINSACAFVLPGSYGSILALSIFGLLFLTIDDESLKVTNHFAMILPLISLISYTEYIDSLHLILNNILHLYILFLITKFFIKNNKNNDIFLTITIPLVLLLLIFRGDLIIGLYIGILSIGIMYLTYNQNDYKKLFYCSTIIMILNIIVQLWEYWAQIPFWLYLLLAGICIIGFVTYKELKKGDEPPKVIEKSNDKEKAQPIIEINQSKPLTTEEVKIQKNIPNFCPNCGIKIQGGNFCRNCGQNLIKYSK